MSSLETFDAIIVGSGQGGNPLANAMAKAGKRTALIERKDVGGTCVNTGCTPTKTMAASARMAYLASRASEYGIVVERFSVSMTRVRERKRQIVQRFREGSERNLEKAQVELIRGEARFSNPREIEVSLMAGGSRSLRAELIFLDTGSRSFIPQIPGLDQVRCLNHESIMELDHVPEHLVVLGGGYIGVEFAQMFRRFGSRVTIVQAAGQLLPREDSDIAAEVLKILREDGITVLLNAETKEAAEAEARVRLRVNAEAGDGPNGPEDTIVEGTHLLVAAGRVPNTEFLNLKGAGIETGPKGFIRVNERLETTAPGIFALGDVTGGPMFTHIAYDDYRILKTNLIEGGSRTVRDRMVPYTVFMDPQLGRIGMTEAEARKSGMKVAIAKMPMSSVARALETGEERGIIKAVVNRETEQVVGAAVLGSEGGEIMSVLQVAMMGKLKYPQLRDAVFAHPTLSESLNNLFFRFEPGS